MEQSINDLFSVILHSEKVASDEKEKYEKVTEQVKLIVDKLGKMKASKLEYMNRVQQLEQGLVNTKVGLRLLKCKEESLSRHLHTVKTDLKLYRDKLNQARESFECSSKNFMSKVSDFTCNYGLTSMGKEKRELEANNAISLLDSQSEILLQETQGLQEQISELEVLVNRKENIAEMKDNMLNKKKGLECQLQIKKGELTQLKSQHAQLTSVPETGEEYVTLYKTIGMYETSEMEAKLKDLMTELNNVTNGVRQMEEQQLRHQYKHWSRQRHLSQKECTDKTASQDLTSTEPNFNL